MDGESTHALLVVGQHAHRFPGGKVPQTDGAVETRSKDLRVGFLALDRGDGALVAAQDVDVGARAHVPDAGDAVAAAGHEHVERRVQCERVHARQMAMIVTDDLVGLQIPALDHFVLATGEEVGVAW